MRRARLAAQMSLTALAMCHYYARSPERNPEGPARGSGRVIRGSSTRVAFRKAGHLSDTPADVSFRCVKTAP
jgi:hypothetical protein